MKLSPDDPRLKRFNFFIEGYDLGRGEFFQSPVSEGTFRKAVELNINTVNEGAPLEGVMVRSRMESEYVNDTPPEEWTI